MNIFATSPCPYESAAMLDDIRVTKMITESVQLLTGALKRHGHYRHLRMRTSLSQLNNRLTLWAAESSENWRWLWRHAMAMCQLFFRRSGKIHACQRDLMDMARRWEEIPPGPLTGFVNAAENKTLGVSFTHMEDVHLAYLLYLNERWDTAKSEPTWKHREWEETA